jgi:cytochrome c-type biogenesis protein CcmE
MKGRHIKYIVGIAILIGTLSWLGVAGYQEGKAYYWTADEVLAQGEQAYNKRIMLLGDVVPGTIRYVDGRLNFSLNYEDATIPVIYEGSAPIPDTFNDSQPIQALVEGKLERAGHFTGYKIQAKCASKYEADPSEMYGKPESG